jgi:hypothetical protein
LGIMGKGRGMGKNALSSTSLPPSLPIQTGEGLSSLGRQRPAAPPGEAVAGDRGNGEGDEGVLLPFLPWAGVLWRGGSTAGGGLLAVVAGAVLVVAMEDSGERKKWSWRCGVPRRAA